MKFINAISNGCYSLLSDKEGSLSSKRFSALFILVAYLSVIYYSVWDLSHKVDTQISEKYISYLKFTQGLLAAMILLLLGVATVAQIASLRRGDKVEEIKNETTNEKSEE